MIPRSNLHTHSTFCDGKNTPEEMVQAAISLGMDSLGFSGHAELPFEDCDSWCMVGDRLRDYRKTVLSLKKKYADCIEVALGIEQDYFSPALSDSYDYVIGSVHYVCPHGYAMATDINPEVFCRELTEYYGGDALRLAKDYFELVANVVKKTNCDIVGHFDLLTKFNESCAYLDEDSSAYQTLALEALDAVLEDNPLIELNTGAMARGRRKVPYPAPFLCKRIAEKKGRMIFNADAHMAEKLLYGFEDAIEYARFCGARELWYYKDGIFQADLIV
ncbi:MAG: histidinol-phosphatase [Clostridia bacterium]|nr:histidinol-phosphatase [Clostridia bacterium]